MSALKPIKCPDCGSEKWRCYNESTVDFIDLRSGETFSDAVGSLVCEGCGCAYEHTDLQHEPDWIFYRRVDE